MTKKQAAVESQGAEQHVAIPPPKFIRAAIRIVGITPYGQHRFSEKARKQMEDSQRGGARSKSKRTREPRDFEQEAHDAMYVAKDGWHGIPAVNFRNAMISACRVAGFFMSRAKLALWVLPDGYDATQPSIGLVRITKGTPKPQRDTVRLESGVASLVYRPFFAPGWEATVMVEFDSEMLGLADIVNLLSRAGRQCGIGEGRNDSPKSNGLGLGAFDVVMEDSKIVSA